MRVGDERRAVRSVRSIERVVLSIDFEFSEKKKKRRPALECRLGRVSSAVERSSNLRRAGDVTVIAAN